MKFKNPLTVEFLRQALSYDKDTGRLFWKQERPLSHFKTPAVAQRWHTVYSGKETGLSISKHGYCQMNLSGNVMRVHRVVWAIHHGEWPNEQIDHINGIRTDNRISNLRLANQSENRRNAAIHSNNASGCSGVYFDNQSRKWRARINSKKRRYIHLGSFKDLNQAIAARKAAEIKYGYHENHGRIN